MLDILRKHASSWVIKVLLGAIVISFIFFFGYSSMRQSRHRGVDNVATVNGRPITVAEYRFILDNNYERLKSTFKGKDVPDFVVKMAKSQTLRQLVSREIELELAADLGVVVPDAQLADAVMKTPYAQRDGQFDPIFYRHQFLPYFKQRFGLDFEKFMKQDIILEELESIFRGVDMGVPVAKSEGEEDVEFKWTFESVAFEPDKLIEAGKVKTADEVRAAAELLINSSPKKWKGLIAPFGISTASVGPISIRERRRLLGGQGTVEDMVEIFSLSPEKPVVGKPIERGGKVFVVRLVERKDIEMSESFWPARDFFRSWMAKLSEKAKVVSYLDEEK
jgi:hypothetical protein